MRRVAGGGGMAGEALLAAVGIPSVHHLREPPRENLQVMQI